VGKGISFLVDPALVENVTLQEYPTVPFRIESEADTVHRSYTWFDAAPLHIR
jgi:hypothetical protein